MNQDRWRRLSDLIDGALAQSAESRDVWLREACKGDPGLFGEVHAMLQSEDQDVTGIQGSLNAARAGFLASNLIASGTRLGPYRIMGLIGQGGMGTVYEGHREDGFEKRVAIKLIRFGLDDDFARRRFLYERQILAKLDHPNIAALLDGGDSAHGLPYLVMEFIEGKPLMEASAGLSIRQKLELFQVILGAVSYAHGNLVVHRDLKPANILIAKGGAPKLLDFGVARLIEEDMARANTMTSGGLMTPDYASPEQIKGETVGVASDIYSLGAVLYELLTGARPHRLKFYSTAEIVRSICETEPRPPSSSVEHQTAKQLKGDLDTLVLHALAKEPQLRYISADAFAAEIEEYLKGRPLKVRPTSTVERAWKFVKRNRLVVGGGLALAASLVIGITVSTIQARRAERRFSQVRELANTFLFDFDKEISNVPGTTKAREMLAATSQKYLDNLAADAGNDRGLLLELATSYEKLGDVQGSPGRSNLGRTKDAAVSYQKAIAILERLSKMDPVYRTRLAADLGFYSRIAGDLIEPAIALQSATRAAEIAEQVYRDAPKNQEAMNNAARAFDILLSIQQGLYHSEDALLSGRKAISLYEQQAAATPTPRLLHSIALAGHRLALVHRNLADLGEAEATERRSMESERKSVGSATKGVSYQSFIAGAHEGLAIIAYSERYPNRGDLTASAAEWQEALDLWSKLASADPNDINRQTMVASVASNLALIRLRQADFAQAEVLSKQGDDAMADLVKRAPGSGLLMNRRPVALSIRALVLARAGDKEAARGKSAAALEMLRSAVLHSGSSVDERLDLCGQLLRHAEVLTMIGDADSARAAVDEVDGLERGLDQELKVHMAMAYQAGSYRMTLAQAEQAAGQLAAAAHNYEQAVKLWQPFQSAQPYIQQKIAQAVSLQNRIR